MTLQEYKDQVIACLIERHGYLPRQATDLAKAWSLVIVVAYEHGDTIDGISKYILRGHKMSKEQWIKENLKLGEVYSGILLGKDGAVDHHLILLPDHLKDIVWDKANSHGIMIGGELPTRREQSLLFANAPGEFESRYYWSGEQSSGDTSCAWLQFFGLGTQHYGLKSIGSAARFVRRIPV